jgi:hypothetical protein
MVQLEGHGPSIDLLDRRAGRACNGAGLRQNPQARRNNPALSTRVSRYFRIGDGSAPVAT